MDFGSRDVTRGHFGSRDFGSSDFGSCTISGPDTLTQVTSDLDALDRHAFNFGPVGSPRRSGRCPFVSAVYLITIFFFFIFIISLF